MNKEGCHFYKLLHCCHCGLISEGPQHWLLWGLNLNLYDTPAWLGVWGDTLLGFLKWTLLPKALSLSVRQSTVQLCGTLFRGNCTNAPDLRDDWFSHWAAKSLTIMDVVKPVLTGWAVVALQASSDIFTLWAKGHATEEEDKASEGKKGVRKRGQKGFSPFGVLEAQPFYQLRSLPLPAQTWRVVVTKKRAMQLLHRLLCHLQTDWCNAQ